MTTTVAERRAAERWFLDRGLPSVVTRRARLRAVWPRSAPVLAGYATLSASSFVTYLLTGRTGLVIDGVPTTVQRIVPVILVLSLPLAAVVGWTVARMVTNHAQAIVSAAAVALVTVSETIKGHTAGLLWTLFAVALVLALTASGLGSVVGWAVRLTLSQLVAVGALLIRALPVVLLSVLVFFNAPVWSMAAAISSGRLGLALGFFVVIAVVFVVSGTMERAEPLLLAATASARHAERLAGTPFEEMPDPVGADSLTRAERFNVVFVLAASEIAQILTVALVTASLFLVLGLILLSPEVLRAWTPHGSSNGTLLGYSFPVPQPLIHVTLFLGALTFMYISARAVGDGEYRSRFLDPLIDDLKLTLLARNRYRNNPVRASDADPKPGVEAQAPDAVGPASRQDA
jgi:hypothetical protein